MSQKMMQLSLVANGYRTADAVRAMGTNDCRNSLISEISKASGLSVNALQGKSELCKSVCACASVRAQCVYVCVE